MENSNKNKKPLRPKITRTLPRPMGLRLLLQPLDHQPLDHHVITQLTVSKKPTPTKKKEQNNQHDFRAIATQLFTPQPITQSNTNEDDSWVWVPSPNNLKQSKI